MSQTYANHRRFDPWFHIVGFGLVLLVLGGAVHRAWVSRGGHDWVWDLLAALLLAITFFMVRTYALHNQDRLIRLEETLRFMALLPKELQPRIQTLTVRQFVALRFAADEELAERVREALDENLDGEAIKKRIQTWRPDTFRV